MEQESSVVIQVGVRELGVREVKVNGQNVRSALRKRSRITTLLACHGHTERPLGCLQPSLFSLNLGVGHSKAPRRGNTLC